MQVKMAEITGKRTLGVEDTRCRWVCWILFAPAIGDVMKRINVQGSSKSKKACDKLLQDRWLLSVHGERIAGLWEMMHNNVEVLQILEKERVYHNMNKMTQISARLTDSYVLCVESATPFEQ